ncbi:MAG: 6-phospho-3-hexuloisomerase [Candidatus Bathyarchaeia archaeon]
MDIESKFEAKILSRFSRSFNEITVHLDKVKKDFEDEKMDALVKALLSSRRIFIYGAGRSGLVGRMFTQRLMHLNLNAYFVGETLTPALESQDMFIAISGSGQTTSTLALTRAAKGRGAKIIVLTAHPSSPLAEAADLIIPIKGKTKLAEYESSAPFTTLFDITCLAYLDSLASELMGRLGLTDKDIEGRHATVE